MHYKIIIAYDGTDFFGWQALPGLPTVAQTMQDLFAKVFNQQIMLRGVSRTDAGVHALGQVATFKTDLNIKLEQLVCAWNNVLPQSIVIQSCQYVADDFNIHAHVEQKTYQYHFFTNRPLPFTARYGWYFRYPVNLDKLKDCLQVFVGTHDFRSFCTGADKEFKRGTVRTIDSAEFEYVEQLQAYRITIKGHSFLRHMIRRIVGACLDVASSDELGVQTLHTALAEKNPAQQLPTAPAQGLVLCEVRYKT